MTASAGGPGTGVTGGARRVRARWLFWVGALAVVVLVALAGDGKRRGAAYAADSTSPTGTRGLVELIEHFGGRVEETSEQPPAEADVALVFPGRIDVDRIDALREWARKGHTIVVTEPVKGLTPGTGGNEPGVATSHGGEVGRGDCTVGALEGVATLRVAGPRITSYEVGGTPAHCFGDGRFSFVAVTPMGRGNLVSIGSGSPFANGTLAEADNGAFAVSLLAPRPGTKVALLRPLEGSVQSQSVWDQVPTGVKLGLGQLVVAFVVYALFRGRRLGKPIIEPQPTELAGSELVSAVGVLLQQTKSPFRAAVILRSGLRRTLCDRLGMPTSTPPDVLADSLAVRSGIDPARARSLLLDVPVATDADLGRLARELDVLRQEVLHVPSA